ncbi:MAG: hypothetical protein M1838_000090 [Thelocarpon superellum]|nr:MAG: hypothetical protein M1838_000090 [Thelocarpon superellum]
MASTRPTRKSSRRSSPFTRHPKRSATPPDPPDPGERERGEKKNFFDQWIEPPLRPPAPSFEDYKGLERHGVLSQMAPLGTMPPNKVKAKAKQDLPKRLAPIKTSMAASAGIKSGPVTPDPTSALGRKRSESKALEEQLQAQQLPPPPPPGPAAPRTPSARSTVREPTLTLSQPARSSAKSSPAQGSSSHATPNSRGQMARAQMKLVVDAAVERATQVGHHHLGAAVKKLYDDSLTNGALADLLDAVLVERATPTQKKDFQHYIKMARRSAKLERSGASSGTRPSASASASASASSHTGLDARSTSYPSSKSPTKNLHLTRPSAARAKVDKLGKVGPAAAEATEPQDKDPKEAKNWRDSTGPRKEKRAKRESGARATAAASTSISNLSNGVMTRGKHSRRRSRSSSSSSALSSIGSPLEASRPPSAGLATGAPISGSRASTGLGPKLHTFSTAPSPTAAALTPTDPTAGSNINKRSSAAAGLEVDEADQAFAAKRQKYTKSFPDVVVKDSSVRAAPSLKLSQPRPVVASKATSTSTSNYPTRLRNGTVKRLAAAGDEAEDLSSPAPSSTGDPPMSALSAHPSRAGTPPPLGRPSKKAKKTARVKVSPMKKKAGVIAGIARSGAGQDGPVGHAATTERGEDDNEDFCSACGGNGDLLCCDGCDRSFHFTCLDPPMDKDQLPETWFCYVCASSRNPQSRYPRGLFAGLLGNLERKNPVAYTLPMDIREYFEGVKTGDEGEYEEAVTQKSRARAGYDEIPDFLKLKDAKGKYVLCFKCGRSALNHQEIIPCDYCSLHWHLDCLDPPMANPPPRAPNGKPRYNWMCPNHVDHELLALDATTRSFSRVGSYNGGMRTHKVRRPKNAKIMDTSLRRGFVNNGLIEIENEASEAEAFVDTPHFGTVYRLPEKGIKLDFIDKVKRLRETRRRVNQSRSQSHSQSRHPEHEPRHDALAASPVRRPLQGVTGGGHAHAKDFHRRSLADQKAALNLAQFAQVNDDLNLGVDEVEKLVDLLIAEAPPAVVKMIDGRAGLAVASPARQEAKAAATTMSHPSSRPPPSPPSSDSRADQMEAAGGNATRAQAQAQAQATTLPITATSSSTSHSSQTSTSTSLSDREKERQRETKALLRLQELVRRRLLVVEGAGAEGELDVDGDGEVKAMDVEIVDVDGDVPPDESGAGMMDGEEPEV